MKKVLVLSHMFPNPVNETAGIFVHSQCVELQKRGIEVHVVSPIPSFPLYPKWKGYKQIAGTTQVGGIPVTYVPTRMIPGGKFFHAYGDFYVKSLTNCIRNLRLHFDFDCIHAHTIFPDGFAAGVLKQEFQVPVITTIHGSDIMVYPKRHPKIWSRTKDALEMSDWIITVSHELLRETKKICSSIQGSVIHNGFDPKVFYPSDQKEARRKLSLPEWGTNLLFVGNLYPVKGPDVLLEAFANVVQEREDLRLFFVGDGTLRSTLENRVQTLGLSDQVSFVGRKKHEEISVWMNSADLIVVPSLSEGLGSINLEAMGCGKPVVGSNVGGIPEIVQHEKTGYLVEPNSVEALTVGLRKVLIEEPELIQSYGLTAHKESSKLTWEQNAVEVSSIYQQLCK